MLDGAARVGELLDEAVAQGMPAIAVTDHGNMFGAYDFWQQAVRARHQADHRDRGLHHAGGRTAPTRPGALGRRRRHQLGRRRRRWRVHAHDPARGDDGRDAQPLPAVLARLHRGLLLQAAHGPGTPVPVCEGRHRDHRLRGRRGADAAPARAVRGGARGRRGVPGHLREGQLLRRDHGPRHRDRAPHPVGAHPAREGARDPAPRDERPPLHPRPRCRRARGAALRPVRLDAQRPEAVQVRTRRSSI